MNANIVTEKHINGLVYNDCVSRRVEEEGQTRIHYEPTTRPLTLDDVLAARQDIEGVYFVTADGKKYFWDRKTGKSRERAS